MKVKNLIVLLAVLAGSHSQAEEPPLLDGNYDVELTIQNKVFLDKMNLTGSSSPLHPHHFGGAISGRMEVPGVFNVPLSGQGHCTLWGNFCKFEFSILAKENGQEFEVFYKMEMSGKAYLDAISGTKTIFTGQAFLKDGRQLGPFTAVKKNE